MVFNLKSESIRACESVYDLTTCCIVKVHNVRGQLEAIVTEMSA